MLGSKDHCGFSPCLSIAFPVSLVVGILVAILFTFGLIPGITTATWIVFGLGVLGLVFVLIAVLLLGCNRCFVLLKCLEKLLPCLLAGIFGTIILSLVALSIVLSIGIFTIILVGLLAFFFSLLIVSLILLIQCVIENRFSNKITEV